mmetsp:Transcript_16168/g.65341  ORF Transcript_16168/g.65341 Transcript_16168/m.65341 type:complete len:492 (+) Transcript_16168:371-1846(+)
MAAASRSTELSFGEQWLVLVVRGQAAVRRVRVGPALRRGPRDHRDGACRWVAVGDGRFCGARRSRATTRRGRLARPWVRPFRLGRPVVRRRRPEARRARRSRSAHRRAHRRDRRARRSGEPRGRGRVSDHRHPRRRDRRRRRRRGRLFARHADGAPHADGRRGPVRRQSRRSALRRRTARRCSRARHERRVDALAPAPAQATAPRARAALRGGVREPIVRRGRPRRGRQRHARGRLGPRLSTFLGRGHELRRRLVVFSVDQSRAFTPGRSIGKRHVLLAPSLRCAAQLARLPRRPRSERSRPGRRPARGRGVLSRVDDRRRRTRAARRVALHVDGDTPARKSRRRPPDNRHGRPRRDRPRRVLRPRGERSRTPRGGAREVGFVFGCETATYRAPRARHDARRDRGAAPLCSGGRAALARRRPLRTARPLAPRRVRRRRRAPRRLVVLQKDRSTTQRPPISGVPPRLIAESHSSMKAGAWSKELSAIWTVHC